MAKVKHDYHVARRSLVRRKLRQLYPEIEPYNTGRLQVSKIHNLYYEECGNPNGKPVVFLHGGPGGGIEPFYRRFFDPAKYRIVLFDQRGSGKSTPNACLKNNTTWDLVRDIEKLRKHLGIDRWMVFGGSWGSTLALAYAETHPGSVTEMVLRGIFLCRKQETDWLYQRGADAVFPDAWEHYLGHIPPEERGNLLAAYHKRLNSKNKKVQLAAALPWSLWEGHTSHLFPSADVEEEFGGERALAFARIECHYFVNDGFMKPDTQLLDNVDRIRHIPCVIVQARYDIVCPIESAWALHRAWPEAKFVLVEDAGHSSTEPGVSAALVEATDGFAAGFTPGA